MELNIGSNIYRNANGIITVQDKEQIVLQIRPDDPRLLLTMDLYDTAGTHVAHLRRNSWAFNSKNRFDIHTSPASGSLFSFPVCLKLVDTDTGGVVLEVNLVEKNTVHIPQGRVYSSKGQLLDITPHRWRFPGKPTMFGSVQDVRAGIVSIG